MFLGISVGVGIIAGLMTLCLYYVGLFVLGKPVVCTTSPNPDSPLQVSCLLCLPSGAALGWFVGLAFLPLISEHSEYLSENNWLPYVVLCGFALAGGILILCIQKVRTIKKQTISLPTYPPTYLHTYIHTHIHTNIHKNVYACITCMHTYIHRYKHT